MSAGFIFNWRSGDSAGKISVTSGAHSGSEAAFRLSSCSAELQEFLRENNASSLRVRFDLIGTPTDLRARNVEAV
jgi:hypothetical protein